MTIAKAITSAAIKSVILSMVVCGVFTVGVGLADEIAVGLAGVVGDEVGVGLLLDRG